MAGLAGGANTGSPIASHPYIVNSLGYAFIGWTLELVGYGLCLQAAGRLINAHRLSRRPLLILYTLMGFLTVISGITIWCIFFWGTLELRTEKAVDAFTYPSAIAPIPTGFLAFIVQGFFAERAYKIVDNSKLFLGYISFLMLVSLGGSIGRSAALLLGILERAESEVLLGTSATWNFASALADISISAVLIYGLAVRKTGYNTPTDNAVTQLINVAIQTAALPSIFAIGSAVSAIAAKGTNRSGTYCLFILVLPAIYVYSFLWCIVSTDRIKLQQSGEKSPPGCDRCQGWLSPAREHEHSAALPPMATPALDSAPTLGYSEGLPGPARHQTQSNASNTGPASVVDLRRALRGRDAHHGSLQIEEDLASDSASTASRLSLDKKGE